MKKEFEEKGITTCELRYEGCKFNNYLSFAHLDKRRYLTEEDLWVVVLACVPCHSIVEEYPRAEMKLTLQKVISDRSLSTRLSD